MDELIDELNGVEIFSKLNIDLGIIILEWQKKTYSRHMKGAMSF